MLQIARSTIWAWFQGLFFLKLKGRLRFSYTLGGKQKQKRTEIFNEIDYNLVPGALNDTKKRKTMQTNDEIGQMLVSGALDDTKKIRTASADIFAKSGPEKPYN